MKKLSYVIVLLLLLTGFTTAVAQEQEMNGFNPNSTNPIHESHIMYKKKVWRRIDLKEKQNLPFFAYNNEITKIIIEAVKNGTLAVYQNDSLKTRMTKEKFMENLKLPDLGGGLSEEEKKLGFSDDASGAGWGDAGAGAAGGGAWDSNAPKKDSAATAATTSSANYFQPNEVSIMELMEDVIFDKTRSRQYYDILALKLVIPAEKFETGLIREVGTFRYKDLLAVFKSMPNEAIWFNSKNSREHRNLADAFALRLFSSHIIKVENPRDEMIVDIYTESPKSGIIASQQIEYNMMEFEHNLWEF